MNVEGHRTHCCVYHGCKYANEDCPVASREIMQEYPCEKCSWAKEEYEEAWQTISKGKQWFGD